jgi:hypothetical protein
VFGKFGVGKTVFAIFQFLRNIGQRILQKLILQSYEEFSMV